MLLKSVLTHWESMENGPMRLGLKDEAPSVGNPVFGGYHRSCPLVVLFRFLYVARPRRRKNKQPPMPLDSLLVGLSGQRNKRCLLGKINAHTCKVIVVIGADFVDFDDPAGHDVGIGSMPLNL